MASGEVFPFAWSGCATSARPRAFPLHCLEHIGAAVPARTHARRRSNVLPHSEQVSVTHARGVGELAQEPGCVLDDGNTPPACCGEIASEGKAERSVSLNDAAVISSDEMIGSGSVNAECDAIEAEHGLVGNGPPLESTGRRVEAQRATPDDGVIISRPPAVSEDFRLFIEAIVDPPDGVADLEAGVLDGDGQPMHRPGSTERDEVPPGPEYPEAFLGPF